MIIRILFVVIFFPLVFASMLQMIWWCTRWVLTGKSLYDDDLLLYVVIEKLFINEIDSGKVEIARSPCVLYCNTAGKLVNGMINMEHDTVPYTMKSRKFANLNILIEYVRSESRKILAYDIRDKDNQPGPDSGWATNLNCSWDGEPDLVIFRYAIVNPNYHNSLLQSQTDGISYGNE